MRLTRTDEGSLDLNFSVSVVEVEELVPAVLVPDPDFDHQLRLDRLHRLHLLLNLRFKVRVLPDDVVNLAHDPLLFRLVMVFRAFSMGVLLR